MDAPMSWTPRTVKRLRGRRTLEEFGKLLDVPKNTVWRWEHGYASPDPDRADRLSGLAVRERFRDDWTLAGSVVHLGDIEEGSRQIANRASRAAGSNYRPRVRTRR
jgi:transcriptional regulator with XRE-family HTH domain